MRFSFRQCCSLVSGTCLIFLLSSCGDGAVLPPLPSGEQTISGTLQPAELSLVRRGTHRVLQDGVHVYYAESSKVNLREIQGKMVTMKGILEHNTDPQDLPVLVVSEVLDVEDTTTDHAITSYKLTLSAPVTWQKQDSPEDGVVFVLREDEEPILHIYQESGEKLPEGGVPIVVDATRATRLIDELTGAHLVAVKRDGAILYFRFTPSNRINSTSLREDFLALLKTVDLQSLKATPKPLSSGTGALGSPCGGSAGVLCPQGSYCEIQDTKENIGRCRAL